MEMNQKTPHFSLEEMRAIYEAAPEKTKSVIFRTARELYPDREDAMKTLYWIRGGGRAFKDQNGRFHKPKYTFQSWPNELAVMEDGTLLEY